MRARGAAHEKSRLVRGTVAVRQCIKSVTEQVFRSNLIGGKLLSELVDSDRIEDFVIENQYYRILMDINL